jgi:hypothetical protein
MIIVGKKWDKGAHYIGRGSPLGNPFAMSNESQLERDRVCDAYESWFATKVAEKDPAVIQELRKLWVMHKNSDVTLGCFCAPKRCHGDTIKGFLIQSSQD